ncbi:MAG: DUF167 domain-containing protein [Phycisphaeraceae bacterium]
MTITADELLPLLDTDANRVLVPVKVVPGARRSRVAGVLGNRVKLNVAAPAEGGKANQAACELLAQAIGVPMRAVTLYRGETDPRKILAVEGRNPTQIALRLAELG